MVEPECFLFGSAARGDADEASDTDVLIVYWSEPSASVRELTKQSVTKELRQNCAFAEYTWGHLNAMFADGHLFAWHLYQEARPLLRIGIDRSEFSFPKPGPYRSARTDALNFLDLLRSSARAVEGGTTSLTYEAGLSYVAIRNIGMSLSALALSRPGFDRHVPFRVAKALRTFQPCDPSIYALLVAARHSSQRGLRAPSLHADALAAALETACRWAETSLETVHDVTHS